MKEVGGSEPRPWHPARTPSAPLVGRGAHTIQWMLQKELCWGLRREGNQTRRMGVQIKRTKNNGWKEHSASSLPRWQRERALQKHTRRGVLMVPVVNALSFHCRGQGFHPWSCRWSGRMEKKKEWREGGQREGTERERRERGGRRKKRRDEGNRRKRGCRKAEGLAPTWHDGPGQWQLRGCHPGASIPGLGWGVG